MYKLLIADDESKIRMGLRQYFPWGELGFEVAAEARDGRQAMDYIAGHPVDVVLTDIKMPVMTGIELAQELHSRKAKIKVVFLTGYKEFEFAQKALVYGVKGYIVKPTKYEELQALFTALKEELDEERRIAGPPPSADASGEPDDGEAAEPGYHEKKITAIRAYVAANYRDVTLEAAAGVFHMNLHYLSKYFKKWSGQNFSDYVISVKMEKAAELLKDFQYKSYEIGSAVGYDNAKHFSRAFKLYFGKSPREYRNSPG